MNIGRRVFCAGLTASLIPTQSAFAQDRTIRLSTPGPAINTLPTEILRLKGFDKEEGFSLDIKQSPGSIAVKAMISGDFDLGLSVGSAVIAAVSGAPVKVVYVHVDKWLYFLYSTANITNIRQLEGKKIAVDSAGGTLDVIVRRAVQASGADLQKTTFISMGNITNIPGALLSGAVDAGVITPPQEFQLLHSPRKYTNLGYLGNFAPGVTGGVATSNKTLRERPDIVRAFLRAHAKAHQFILNNRNETIPVISKFLNLTADDAAVAYDTTIRTYFQKGGSVSPEQQKVFIAETVRGLKLARTPEPTSVFDFSFLPESAR